MSSDDAFSKTLPSKPMTPSKQSDMNFTESCIFKAAMHGVTGGVMGGMFGIFMASVEPPVGDVDTKLFSKQMLRRTLKDMGSSMKSYAKGFALCGLVYQGCECLIEKEFARHDTYTILASGCAAGAVLGATGGPQTMALGCGGFAAFSVAMEAFMDSYY